MTVAALTLLLTSAYIVAQVRITRLLRPRTLSDSLWKRIRLYTITLSLVLVARVMAMCLQLPLSKSAVMLQVARVVLFIADATVAALLCVTRVVRPVVEALSLS